MYVEKSVDENCFALSQYAVRFFIERKSKEIGVLGYPK